MHAFRSLLKAPGFTLIAVLALALGIGANTAIFSVVHGVLLRPLPYPNQEQLVFLGEWSEQVPQMSVSYPNFVDFRDRQHSFSAFGGARGQGFNFVGPSDTERVTGSMASHELFTALGVPPIRGRLYSAADDKPGVERTVVLRESFWRRAFAARDSAIGEKIQLSGNFYTIIGVLPDAFQYPNATTQLWVPLGLWADDYKERGSHPGIYCVGRLKPGVSFDAAVADLKAVAAQLATEYRDSNAGNSVSMQLLTDRAFGSVRTALFVLLGAAGFVLLIACANVANLQLARAHARAREFAVRAALGAGRGRIVRQLLIESTVLGLLGCVAGLLLGVWATDALRTLLPPNTPRLAEVGLNGWVFGFAVLVSVTTSIVFGLVPALHASRQDLREALSQGGRSGSTGGNRWRAALIVGEFALTCVLLVGAGLMLQTLTKLYNADPGYSTERTATFNWVLPGFAYGEPAQRLPLIERALDRVAALPGVTSVGIINPLPLGGGGNQNTYYVEGTPEPAPGKQPSTEVFQASGSAFSTLQIPLIAGRPFSPADSLTAPKVVIIDTLFAEKNFGKGVDPLGKRIVYGSRRPTNESNWMTVIGVAAHIENYGPGQPTREQTYTPHTQSVPSVMTFVVRTGLDPAALTPTLRGAMREIATDLPIYSVSTMDELFVQNIGTQRLTVWLLGAFAALALLLAAVGLYGVLSYNVGQRTRELGVRMALGATPGAVLQLIFSQGGKLAALGLAIGLLASLGLTQFLSSVLYETSAFDPLSFVAVVVVLLLVGAVACWLPARRATRVDPMEALRAD